MEEAKKIKQDTEELSKIIKTVFLIYDHVRMLSKNIDEFNTSKIVITRDIKKKTLSQVFEFYKRYPYQMTSNLNNKTRYFIELMKKIFSYNFMPEVTNIQIILIYYLIYIFHKDTAKEDIQKFQHQFKILLLSTVKEYSHYLAILKIIGLLSENQHNTDMDFLNKCKIIQNLNKIEFNSSLSSFLLLKDSIPQYKNINFPKLDSKDNENIYN